MTLIPIDEAGESRTLTVKVPYQQIIKRLGQPNVEEPGDKVPASWAFKEKESGLTGFIWAYRVPKSMLGKCNEFSGDGSFDLLSRIFPGRVIKG